MNNNRSENWKNNNYKENLINNKEQQVVYYTDELNDEFSTAKIIPRKIDASYVYIHRNQLWNCASYVLQNILSMPIKVLYSKMKFKIEYVGKEKFKQCKNEGYFIYANHTQPFADTFIPSIANYPKRNFFIVNPENISMKGLGTIVEMLGAIPVPGDKVSTKNFLETIEKRVANKESITIYPEAHIWPYYTKIRPFKAVSFKYPVKLSKPSFGITNTYQSYGKNSKKIKIVTYIDGPFYGENAQELRDKVYNCMCERAKNSNVEVIRYVKNNVYKD